MNEPRSQRLVALGVLALALVAVAGTVVLPGAFRSVQPLAPDSLTYLEWNPGRTPAYPAFLFLVRLLSPSRGLLGPLQLFIFMASAAWCAFSFAQFFRQPAMALLFAAGVMLHPQLVSYAFVTLPESLFASALLANIACVLRAARSSKASHYALVGLTLALLILLKPSGYGVAAGLAAVLWCIRPLGWREAAAAIAVLAVTLGVVATTNLVRRGYFSTQAQGGFSIVAHVGPFVDPMPTGPLAGVADAIASDVRPHREALERIDSLSLYYFFASHDYHVIERIVRQRIGADVERRYGAAAADDQQFPSNPILLREITTIGAALARRAIMEQPRAYVRHVSAQLYGLWLLPLFQTPASIAHFTAALDDIRAASPALDRSPVAFRAVPLSVFVALRALLLTVLGASVVALLLALVCRAPRYLPLGYAALALHANYVLVAAVQPGLPRYALVMWPAAAFILAGSTALAADAYVRRR